MARLSPAERQPPSQSEPNPSHSISLHSYRNPLLHCKLRTLPAGSGIPPRTCTDTFPSRTSKSSAADSLAATTPKRPQMPIWPHRSQTEKDCAQCAIYFTPRETELDDIRK